MPFAQRVRVWLQASVTLGLVAGLLVAQETVSLVGSGSNLAGSLYSAWTSQYGKAHANMRVSYLPLGTADSLKEIREGTGDFGGGEIPLTDAQKHTGKFTLVQFPTVLVAIVPIYKLPGKLDLKFSGDMLAGIYLGDIKNWNDPRIAKVNPGVTLPDLTISVVHLSGVKGSNYILTDYLSRTSPEWKSKIGKSGSPNWPVGEGIARSEGVATKVSTTPGAIGYVELTYAKHKDIAAGSVQNAAGQFVKPTSATITAACTGSEKSIPDDLGASLVNAGGKDAYPLTSFTWIYVPSSGLPSARSRALKEFWNWALTDGREVANELGYTELTPSIAARARQVLNSVE